MTEQEYEQLKTKVENLLPCPKPKGVEACNTNNQSATIRCFWQNNLGLKAELESMAREQTQTHELKQWQEDFNSRYPVKEQPTLFERVPGMGQMWGTDLQGNATNPELTTDR